MRRTRRRKCLHCQELFRADPRSGYRQRYCSQPQCRKASHAQAQRRWLCKPANRDYFRGPAHVQRVRVWRLAHPGYARKRLAATPLQDPSLTQVIDHSQENASFGTRALHDLLSRQAPVLVGLIATLTGEPLQDAIVATARKWVSLGEDILQGVHDGKTCVGARPGTHGAASV